MYGKIEKFYFWSEKHKAIKIRKRLKVRRVIAVSRANCNSYLKGHFKKQVENMQDEVIIEELGKACNKTIHF